MKYTDFNPDAPKLQLGQVVDNEPGNITIQYQIVSGKTVLEQGKARLWKLELSDIDVEADGTATNARLSKNHRTLMPKDYVFEADGLGAQKQ